jgi:hypothetical protein
MNRALILVLLLPLGACYVDQKRDVAICEIEARRTFPDVDPNQEHAFIPWLTLFGHNMEICMQAKGYERNVLDDRCLIGRVNFVLQAGCYAPGGRFQRLLFDLERRFF